MIGNPKPERIMDRVRRHLKRRDVEAAEQRVMQAVRREDRYCRFPLCGCGRLKLVLDVCHAEHRGMGGNPKLDRTQPENLILLCRPRHRAHKFSLDKKTLRAVPLTDAGLRGPVRWWARWDDVWALAADNGSILGGRDVDGWVILAEETARHQFLPFTPAQREILQLLAGMEC